MDFMTINDIVEEWDLDLITNDISAWMYYPKYNFVYNKLWIAESQGLECAPMGIYPSEYPIIIKPIINLFGMSRGFRIIKDDDEYDNNIMDGFFWEEYLSGDHLCIDLILLEGKIKFHSCLKSISNNNGTFRCHYLIKNHVLSKHITDWIDEHLSDYTGCLNLETIDNKIIECHLRLNGDSQLYNEDFFIQVDAILKNKISKINFELEMKYLFPIFVDKDFNEDLVDKDEIKEIIKEGNGLTVFFQDIDGEYQSEHKSRFLIFDTSTMEYGVNIVKDILKYIHNL